ncbi:monocyte chemotactic protein 1B [Amia ocellicauda]|uniref:monocyte chemotactic protein 1B n=1 Tax=Amia ocellicauda TaxID=2972642 RepID=UPI0034643B22
MKYTSAAFLFVTAWAVCTFAYNGPPASCCLVVSDTKLKLDRIVNYTLQKKGVCPVDAVVFHTIRGKKVCSDPEKDWVKNAIEKVDQREVGSKNINIPRRQKKGRKLRKGTNRKQRKPKNRQ